MSPVLESSKVDMATGVALPVQSSSSQECCEDKIWKIMKVSTTPMVNTIYLENKIDHTNKHRKNLS